MLERIKEEDSTMEEEDRLTKREIAYDNRIDYDEDEDDEFE